MKQTARQMSRGMARDAEARRFNVALVESMEKQPPIADTSTWIVVGSPSEGISREFSFDEFYKLIRRWAVSRGESVQINNPAFCRFGACDLTNQIIQMLLDNSVIVTAKAEFRLKKETK